MQNYPSKKPKNVHFVTSEFCFLLFGFSSVLFGFQNRTNVHDGRAQLIPLHQK